MRGLPGVDSTPRIPDGSRGSSVLSSKEPHSPAHTRRSHVPAEHAVRGPHSRLSGALGSQNVPNGACHLTSHPLLALPGARNLLRAEGLGLPHLQTETRIPRKMAASCFQGCRSTVQKGGAASWRVPESALGGVSVEFTAFWLLKRHPGKGTGLRKLVHVHFKLEKWAFFPRLRNRLSIF